MSLRRLLGLDRSGQLPVDTGPGAPLRPWTLPNLIGFTRLALLPVFLALAFSSEDGRSAWPAVVYAVIGWSDYLDGFTARLTGQFSRLGMLLDPAVDRLLVICGAIVCWYHDLLPQVGMTLLLAREVAMFALARWGLRRSLVMQVNWFGRLGVWPVMSAPFFAMVGLPALGAVCLWVGLPMMLIATALYLQGARRQLTARRTLKVN